MQRLFVRAATAAAVLFAAGAAHAAVLAEYTFADAQNVSSLPATTLGAGVASSSMAIGAGMDVNGFGGDTFTGYDTDDQADLAAAIAQNSYFSLTLAPAAGQKLSVTNVAGQSVSQNVVRDVYVLSNVGGFTADASLATFKTGDFRDTPFSVDLSGITGQAAPVELRFYFVGRGSYESRGFGQGALTVTGEASAVPEPASMAGLSAAAVGLLARRRRA